MSELRNLFRKQNQITLKKNRKSMSKGFMWTKKHKREMEVWLKQKKLGLEGIMNGFGKR